MVISEQLASAEQKQTAVSPHKIAYLLQNVGQVNFRQEVGDTIPVKQTVLGLQQAGYDVKLMQLTADEVRGYDDITEIDDYDLQPLGITGKRPYLLFEKSVRHLQTVLRLPYFAAFDSYRFYKMCCQTLPHYDLCHEHNGLFSIGAALACKKTNTPYVLTFSADPLLELELVGKPLHGLHASAAHRAARLTYDTADCILCVSEPAKKHLVNVWQVEPDKIFIMPNGVEAEMFTGPFDDDVMRANLGIGDAPIIMFLGWFQQWHGLDKLVESFRSVQTAVPEARLILVGDGPAREMIAEKIAELGLANKAKISGLIPREEVPAYLNVADITVLPYPQLPQEMWFSPLKLYEYMAAGKAIVASDCGQISEVIDDGRNGLLLQPGNINQLTQTLIRLLQSSAERDRLGRQAYADAVTKYSWKEYINRLEMIYETAVSQPRSDRTGF